jgi:hypothetical protein
VQVAPRNSAIGQFGELKVSKFSILSTVRCTINIPSVHHRFKHKRITSIEKKYHRCPSYLHIMTASTESKMSNSLATTTKTRNYKVASIPADGIGQEVVSAAIEVVQKLAQISKTFTINFEHIPWGTAYYRSTEDMSTRMYWRS